MDNSFAKKYFLYTHNNSSELGEFKDNIDGIVINGNIFAHSKKSIEEKIISYGYHTLIDPMIYVLQAKVKYQIMKKDKKTKEESENFIKPSIIKMLKNYDIDFDENEVLDNDKDKTLYSFLKIEKIDIQKFLKRINDLDDELNGKETKSIFMNILKEQDKNKNVFMAPQFIPQNKEYIEINKKILQMKEFDFIPFYIDKESLSQNNYLKMAEEIFKINKDSEIIIWVEANVKKYFEEIILNINKIGFKKISFRYANFSQMIICQKNEIKINKWINGFGYGEERNILPIGGGLPVNKVYSPIKHKRLRFEDFWYEINFLNNNPKKYIKEYCGCIICAKLLNKSPTLDPLYMFSDFKIGSNERIYASKIAQKISVRHFVYNKIREIDFYNLTELKDDLNLWKLDKKRI